MITIRTDDSKKIMGKTSLPFGIDECEVDNVKNINPGKIIDNFVDMTVRKDVSYDDCEYNDNAILSTLYMKEKQYDIIRKYIKNSIEIARATGIFKKDKLQIIENGITIVDKNIPEISTFLLNIFQPDYKIKDTTTKNLQESKFDIIGNTHQKLIVSERKQKSLSALLKDFNVPETISSDINQLYIEGFEIKTITSLFLGLFGFLKTFNQEETKTDYAKKAREKYKNRKNEVFNSDDEFESSDDEF